MTDAPSSADDRTDLDLVARWKVGDQAAATALVSRHASAVARFASSLGGRGEQVEVQDGHAVTAYSALDTVVAEETQLRLQQALGKLTALQREVFTLRVSEGLSYKEIAEVAGTTEGAARVHYHNAMRAIKEHVDD